MKRNQPQVGAIVSNSQYGLIHPQISLITHTCPICQANHGRRQGKKH
jgi:hypothetical protein